MITLLTGDCREQLQTLPAGSVQTCVTSPPYYGLRVYGNDPREIGQEATPQAYVAALVAVFAEVWRVLRDDGTLWVNLGDSYTQTSIRHRRHLYAPGYGGDGDGGFGAGHQSADELIDNTFSTAAASGIPPKNLLGMPWRVAFALQDAGWILRSDIIWSKPNPMPESVRDRPTRAHEYLFLFAKRPRYFYDADAIREENSPDMQRRAALGHTRGPNGKTDASRRDSATLRGEDAKAIDANGRNRRSVWTIATQPYSGAHFATMPEALIEPCILAGSASQACETCGAAWGRVVEREAMIVRDGPKSEANRGQNRTATSGTMISPPKCTTLGFAPACRCESNTGSARSVVLDPFCGSGTVMRVAERFGRDAIGIDLSYQELQEARTNGVQTELFR